MHTVATDAEEQVSLLKQVIKLFWNISPSEEADPSIRLAVELAFHKPNESTPDTTQNPTEKDEASLLSEGDHKLIWLDLDLKFWLDLEQILTDSCGIALQNNNELASWFVSVVQSRPPSLSCGQ
jgi:hypothetical protein